MATIEHAKKNGKKFLNPVPTAAQTGAISDTLWDYITSKNEIIPKHPLGPFKTDASIYQTLSASGLRVNWLGHASVLIEIDGKRILTDPAWSERASFVQFAGPKRFFPSPLQVKELPSLDAIIISHDHYDHLDTDTIKELAGTGAPFYCSLGVGKYLEEWGIVKNRITEMDWSDSVSLGNDCTITATPARHFSGRGLHNRFETLWSSFVIKGPLHNVFFGADSGFYPGFQDIGDAFGPFDLTILGIGAYNKNWASIHMDPEEAINAHLMLRGKVMMPMHWGTFNLALHAWKEPVERVLEYAKEKQVPLFLPEPGKPTEVTGAEVILNWWEVSGA